jgi:hypothetical protein
LSSDKGKGQAGKVAAAAGAADNDVRVVAGHFELFFGLQADDGLVKHHVVEHAAQGIAGFPAGVAHRCFDGFGNGDAQAARRVGIFFQGFLSGFGFRAGGCDALAAPGFHHGFAVGLLVEADADHEHLAGQPVLGAGKGEGAAPLAGAGFGGDVLDAENLVVIGLGDGRVGLVAARRAQAFIFKVNFRRCAQRLSQKPWPGSMGRRPPDGRTSRTGSGMSIQRSELTSCSIRFMGNTGASMSGPMGLPSGPRAGSF